MIAQSTFDTKEFGRIEVKRANGKGTSAGKAYFFKDDYEADVADDGSFTNVWGVPFLVHWPRTRSSQDALLEVVMPRTVGRAAVETCDVELGVVR